MSDSNQKPKEGETSIDVARRRLLAKAIYVPPTVIGALALTLEGCQQASCNPTNCNPALPPCNPDTNPCVPNGQSCNPTTCNPATP